MEQNPFGFGRTVKPGFSDKFSIPETDFLQQSQEIHSWYGAALSLEPIGKARLDVFLNGARRRLIGDRKPAAVF